MKQRKVIVITGGSDGIGKAAAQQLVAEGYEVVIVGRSPEKTKQVADDLHAAYYIADFAKLSSVRKLAYQLDKDYPRIDVLVNNAGAVFSERALTEDGFEITFQVNHLAAFLLTTLLLPNLIRSSAYVIQTSSIASRLFSKFDINDLQSEHDYSPNTAYGNSKLMNILFTKELHRRYHNKGISSVAFHPGTLATGFAQQSTSWLRWVYATPLKRIVLRPAQQGGDALVWLIKGTPGNAWEPGEYYEKNKLAKKQSPYANNAELSSKLWSHSEALINGYTHRKTAA